MNVIAIQNKAVVIQILIEQMCFISVNGPARELVVMALLSVLEI